MSDRFVIEHEDGVRVDFVGRDADARAYAEQLANVWLARASLIDPTSGRTIVCYEPARVGAAR